MSPFWAPLMPTGALPCSPIGLASRFPFPAREPLWVPRLLSSLPRKNLGSSKPTKTKKPKPKQLRLNFTPSRRWYGNGAGGGSRMLRTEGSPELRLGECLLWLGCMKIKFRLREFRKKCGALKSQKPKNPKQNQKPIFSLPAQSLSYLPSLIFVNAIPYFVL